MIVPHIFGSDNILMFRDDFICPMTVIWKGIGFFIILYSRDFYRDIYCQLMQVTDSQ